MSVEGKSVDLSGAWPLYEEVEAHLEAFGRGKLQKKYPDRDPSVASFEPGKLDGLEHLSDLVVDVVVRIVKAVNAVGFTYEDWCSSFECKAQRKIYIEKTAVDVILDAERRHQRRIKTVDYNKVGEDKILEISSQKAAEGLQMLKDKADTDHQPQRIRTMESEHLDAARHLSLLIKGGRYKKLSSAQLLLARELLDKMKEGCGDRHLVGRKELAGFLGHEEKTMDSWARQGKIQRAGKLTDRTTGQRIYKYDLIEVVWGLLTREARVAA